MDLSKLRSRRSILALALAGAASRVVPARAQSTAGCEIGWTNGLLTIGGSDCKLLSPPGMDGAELGLPPQMVDGRTSGGTTPATTSTSSTSSQGTSSTGTTTTSSPSSTTSTTSPQAERQARLQAHRSKKRRKRGRRTDQKQTQKGRRHTQRKDRRDAQEEADTLASLKRCKDFTDQKSAVEYLAQYSDAQQFLDPDKDGMACEDLPPVTCRQVWTEEVDRQGVTSWFKRHGFTSSNDPYGLYDSDKKLFCPNQPETAAQSSANG